jgi:hypothetical protein
MAEARKQTWNMTNIGIRAQSGKSAFFFCSKVELKFDLTQPKTALIEKQIRKTKRFSTLFVKADCPTTKALL